MIDLPWLFRDPDVPSKSASDAQDLADFVSVRVLKGNRIAPVMVERTCLCAYVVFCRAGITWKVWLISSKDFPDAELPLPENLNRANVRAPRGTTEVIARRIMGQRNG